MVTGGTMEEAIDKLQNAIYQVKPGQENDHINFSNYNINLVLCEINTEHHVSWWSMIQIMRSMYLCEQEIHEHGYVPEYDVWFETHMNETCQKKRRKLNIEIQKMYWLVERSWELDVRDKLFLLSKLWSHFRPILSSYGAVRRSIMSDLINHFRRKWCQVKCEHTLNQ